MQYLKLGPIKIPYRIQSKGQEKSFEICGIKIPFSTYMKDNRKYYKIFGLSFQFKGQDKLFITQSYSNYLMKEELDEKKIEEIASHIFKEKLGYELNLKNPRSMNEKIFWLKLNYHNPLVTTCCDKYSVKAYVDELLGPGHTVETLKCWDNAKEIDFSVLPNRYALKVNWASGYNVIVKDSSTINEEEIRSKVEHWMKPQQNSYYQTFNWGYKNMKPVVYAEKYMEQCEGQLYDYKFFCCNGKVKFWFIATERYGEAKLTHDFFDMDFHKLDFHYGDRAHSELDLQKPKYYNEMIRCAEILSAPFPFVRVDFYEAEDTYYVGEMTFYPGGGILPFDPEEWDYKMGKYIDLPELTEEGER